MSRPVVPPTRHSRRDHNSPVSSQATPNMSHRQASSDQPELLRGSSVSSTRPGVHRPTERFADRDPSRYSHSFDLDPVVLKLKHPGAYLNYNPLANGALKDSMNSDVPTLIRRRTLTVPDRGENQSLPRAKKNILALETSDQSCLSNPWRGLVLAVTCCIPAMCLSRLGGITSKSEQQAWREKVVLCLISALMCAGLGFITFGFNRVLCPFDSSKITATAFLAMRPAHQVIVRGSVYDMTSILTTHANLRFFADKPAQSAVIKDISAKDVSAFFPVMTASCQANLLKAVPMTCSSPDVPNLVGCHPVSAVSLLPSLFVSRVTYGWSDLPAAGPLAVFNGRLLNLNDFIARNVSVFSPLIDQDIRRHLGKDLTLSLSRIAGGDEAGKCLQSAFQIGYVDSDSIGCFTSNLILTSAFVLVAALIMIKFFFAIWFQWFMSHRLGLLAKNFRPKKAMRREEIEKGNFPYAMNDRVGQLKTSVKSTAPVGVRRSGTLLKRSLTLKSKSGYGRELYTIMLVTCYSEDRQGIKNTFDSLAETDYNEDFKLLFIVADGVVKGKGNDETTPEMIISLLELDPNWPRPSSFAYLTLADGSKALNYAQVYVAWYNHNGRSVPTILVVKTGNPDEQNAAKPGNRGKRDSQIMLMRFLERITFNDRLCPFEYDLFQKMHYLMGVTPDHFEIILMCDADTVVMPDSLARMVACISSDPLIMGLCGETRIANKSESYVIPNLLRLPESKCLNIIYRTILQKRSSRALGQLLAFQAASPCIASNARKAMAGSLS